MSQIRVTIELPETSTSKLRADLISSLESWLKRFGATLTPDGAGWRAKAEVDENEERGPALPSKRPGWGNV